MNISIHQAVSSGCNNYLAKPIGYGELMSVVRKWLNVLLIRVPILTRNFQQEFSKLSGTGICFAVWNSNFRPGRSITMEFP